MIFLNSIKAKKETVYSIAGVSNTRAAKGVYAAIKMKKYSHILQHMWPLRDFF